MRIAINTRFLIKGKLEGLGWHNYALCRELVRQHPDDQFLFLFDRPFDPAFVTEPNVEGMVISPPARHPLLWYLWFEWAVPPVLRKWRADVFLSPDGYCSLRTPVPTVMLTHDIAYVHYPAQVPKLVQKYYDYYVPKYLKRAERIITVSQYVKLDITDQYNIGEEKISVAHNAARAGFRPLPETEKIAVRAQYSAGRPYFFYLGAIHPRKNVDRLIRAFSIFKQRSGSPVKLLITGRLAWRTGPVKEAFEQSDFQDDICFLGYVSEKELVRLLGSALALTYVSLAEGFGLPIIEAMGCDTPVITSNVSSMPEVAGKAALLVDPHSENAIAEAMYKLYTQPELQLKLRAAGREQHRRFSWEKTAGKVYTQLIAACGITG